MHSEYVFVRGVWDDLNFLGKPEGKVQHLQVLIPKYGWMLPAILRCFLRLGVWVPSQTDDFGENKKTLKLR